MPATICKPLLKWVGGKTQILPTVLASFPPQVETYIEPFLGGGSVLLGALSSGRVQGRAVASDINAHLINFYQQVQAAPDALLNAIESLLSSVSLETLEQRYYAERVLFNEREEDPIPAAARFWFLNKTSFRGVYREGPRGYNVPFGHPATLPRVDATHFRDVSRLIQNVTFTCESYERALARVPNDAFVYLDPPYAPVDAHSFVSYTADSFDHAAFFDRCTALNCHWVMSNADVPRVRAAFPSPPFHIESIQVRRAIHSKDPSAQAGEVVVSSPRRT